MIAMSTGCDTLVSWKRKWAEVFTITAMIYDLPAGRFSAWLLFVLTRVCIVIISSAECLECIEKRQHQGWCGR